MIKICILENNIENVGDTRGYLRAFANNTNTIIKEKTFFKAEDMIENPADICIVDFKAFLENQNMLEEWQNKNKLKFIFITSNIQDIVEIMQYHPEQFFVLSPVQEDSLIKIISNLKEKIRQSAIVVKLGRNEDRRIHIKDLNYINITKRNLQYHLVNGEEYEGQTLRHSFCKEVEPLLVKPELFFIQPSLLINLTNVEVLWADHLQFEDGTIVYFPKTAYENIKNAWKNYLI